MKTDPYYIVKGPVVTEESTLQMDTRNQYAFRVDPRANKTQIRDALETIFNVKVVSINTMNYRGKRVGRRPRARGKRADWKKAIVTLREGDKIDIL